ncbi:MAG: SpoIIE family protein phosphatase [Permianibacter sp.]
MAAAAPLRILIIEDDPLQQTLLRSLMEAAGYTVVSTDTGQGALAHFEHIPPDVVLLDYELPDISGRDLVRELRQRQQDWLPILFLSAHNDIEVQRDCLLSGGDDFIVKPYDFTILDAKIQSLCRVAALQQQIRKQAAQLQAHLDADAEEAEAAHYLYSRLTSTNEHTVAGCSQWLQPASKFSGDIICTATGSNGHHYLLLADATGHGLSAAIGLIPVSQVFYSMSRKGHQLSRIVREMNLQVRRFTPVYRFVAAIVVEIDPFTQRLDVWNGGMPAGLKIQQKDNTQLTFPSRHVALGLSMDEEFNSDVESAPYEPGDPLLLYSDGLCDAENSQGVRLGSTALEQLLQEHGKQLTLAHVQNLLYQHLAGVVAHDDVAVVLCRLSMEEADAPTAQNAPRRLPAECALTLRLHDQLIGEFELVPTVVEWCRRAGVREAAIARLHTVLTELVTNAIDHGILLLDSQLKVGPVGFFRYLEERASRLYQLHDKQLEVHIALQNDAVGAVAHISVSDSGPGFQYQHTEAKTEETAQSGRGLRLVRELTESLSFQGNGSKVNARLRI